MDLCLVAKRGMSVVYFLRVFVIKNIGSEARRILFLKMYNNNISKNEISHV